MALENAKKFLEQVMNDEALRDRVMEEGAAGIAAAAKELGFDVTEEELGEAVKAMRRAEEPQELSLDELDEVSAGGPGCDVEKIRDKDIYSLSIQERKYMYYRLDVLRNTKSMEECQDIMGREFHRFGIPPLTAAFVAKWYSSKVSVENIELQLRLDDVFGD